MNTNFSISTETPALKKDDLVVVPCFVAEPETMKPVEGQLIGDLKEDGLFLLLNQRGENGEYRAAIVFFSREGMKQKLVCDRLVTAIEVADYHNCQRVVVPVKELTNETLTPLLLTTVLHCGSCMLKQRNKLHHVAEVSLVAPAGMLSSVGYGLQQPTPLCRLCTLPE